MGETVEAHAASLLAIQNLSQGSKIVDEYTEEF
jgi:hypothetical protein